MISGLYKGHTALSKLLIFIALLLIGFGLTTIIGFLLIQPLFGFDVIHHPELFTDFSNPNNLGMMKFMQFLNSIGIFVFPPLVFAFLVSENWKSYLNLDLIPPLIIGIAAALIMVFSQPWVNLMVVLNESLSLPDFLNAIEEWMRGKEDAAAEITASFLKMENGLDLAINILIVGMIPALGEELLFRGLIQNQIIKRSGNIHLGIWISAFLFSAIHLQFYGFFPRMMLGGLFGYMLVWTGSLWVPILAHFVNNAGAVIIQYFIGGEMAEEQLDTLGTTSDDWMYLLITGVFLTYLIHFIWKTRKIKA